MVVNNVGKQLNTFLKLRAWVTAYFFKLVLLGTLKVVAIYITVEYFFYSFLKSFSPCVNFCQHDFGVTLDLRF